MGILIRLTFAEFFICYVQRLSPTKVHNMHAVLIRTSAKGFRPTFRATMALKAIGRKDGIGKSVCSQMVFMISGSSPSNHFSTKVMGRIPDLTLVNASVPLGEPLAKFDLYGKRDLSWYTGKAPLPGVCPGVTQDGHITSLPLLNLSPGITKKHIMDYFDNTWTMTEVLNAALQGHKSFFVAPPHNLRHPMVFYYGHTACLYINTLIIAGLLPGPLNAEYERVFEMGVDEVRRVCPRSDYIYTGSMHRQQDRRNGTNIVDK